jgi:hypothetical protein
MANCTFFSKFLNFSKKSKNFLEKWLDFHRFFGKAISPNSWFSFILSEVDSESRCTLRKTIFKREPLQFHLRKDTRCSTFFQKVFQKIKCFREVSRSFLKNIWFSRSFPKNIWFSRSVPKTTCLKFTCMQKWHHLRILFGFLGRLGWWRSSPSTLDDRGLHRCPRFRLCGGTKTFAGVSDVSDRHEA